MGKIIIGFVILVALYAGFVAPYYEFTGFDIHKPLVEASGIVVATPTPTPSPTPTLLGAARPVFDDAWGLLAWALVLFIPAAALLGAINRWLWVPARLRWADQVTGLHPIEVKPGASLLGRVGAAVGLGDPLNDVVTNYNHAPAPNYRVQSGRAGLAVTPHAHGLTDTDLLEHASKHVDIRKQVARGPGRGANRSDHLANAGVFDAMARAQNARAERAQLALEQARERAQPLAPDAPGAPVELLSMKAAVQLSTPTKWILGQNETTGKLAIFDPSTASHIGIFGATNTGKTSSTAMLAAGYALHFGYKLIIYDGKGGADWSILKPWGVYHDSEAATFADQLEPLLIEHEQRAQAIKAAGVSMYSELPTPPAPWFVMVEEYGDLNSSMTPANRKKANGILIKLGRKSRYTGIHLCMIDQSPDEWEKELLQNTKCKIVYQLNDASTIKEYHTASLADQGEFYLRGERYKSWYARPKMRAFLSQIGPITPALLPAPVGEQVNGNGDRSMVNTHMNGAVNVHTVGGDTPENGPIPHSPTVNSKRVNGEQVDGAPTYTPSELEQMVWAWREANQDGSQADLRREFAGQGIQISRGHVFNCWHSYSEQGGSGNE